MSPGPQPLLILGAGRFAVEVADIVSAIPRFLVAGFVQNVDPATREGALEGLPVYWVSEVARFARTHMAVCAIGAAKRSALIEEVAGYGIAYATVIHPSAVVSRTSEVGAGTIISPGAVLAARSRLGRYVIVNRGAMIGHHTEVGDFATLGPGVNIAGSTRIGASTFIGMGAIIKDHLSVGSRCFIGAGAVVLKDLPDGEAVLSGRSPGSSGAATAPY